MATTGKAARWPPRPGPPAAQFQREKPTGQKRRLGGARPRPYNRE